MTDASTGSTQYFLLLSYKKVIGHFTWEKVFLIFANIYVA